MDRIATWATTRSLPFGLIAASAFLLWPGAVGPGYDAAIFTLIGYRLRAGDMPYRDVWEHKPPGIFLADASVQSLLPWLDPWTPVWLLSVVCAAALGLVVASGLRANGHPKLAPWCALMTTATVAAFPLSYGGGETELIASVPAAIAVLLMSRRAGIVTAFGSGALLGAALGTSWHLAPAAAVAFWLALQNPDRRRRALLLVSGALAVGVAMVAWLIVGGAWADAFDALVTFNAIYRAANLIDPIVKLSPSAGAALLVLAGLIGLVALIRRERPALLIGAAAWLAIAAVMFVAEGRLGAHYLTSIAVPLGLLSAPGLSLVASRRSGGLANSARAIGQLALVVALGTSAFATIYWTRSLGDTYAARATSLQLAADRLRQLDCTQTLLVWGHAPEIYYRSGLRPASRFVSLPALMTEGYATADNVQRVVNELDAARPAAVIDASSWGGALVTFPLLQSGSLSLHDGRYVDALDPIRDLVRQRYVSAGDIAEWPSYRAVEQRTGPGTTSAIAHLPDPLCVR